MSKPTVSKSTDSQPHQPSITSTLPAMPTMPRGSFGRFGAQLLPSGRTLFRLWAPSREAVAVTLEGQETVAMRALEGGWFELELECAAGTQYRYRFDQDLLVPDPASRFQPDDVHGPSQVVDPHSYVWHQTDWHGRPWEETVLYELHVGAFGGADGYRGVAQRLPELLQLGITAIELMPLNDFPGARNWGYDGVLPYAPDSAYGTPDELKSLIDQAHALGLMVFLDVVYNHFGPDGNYLHAYAEPFFKESVHTPWGPAIDFDRPEVRAFFTENALYWLSEFRFDGLRFDAVHAIDNHGWLREMAETVRRSLPERHVHLVLENEHNSAGLLESHFDAQWSDDAHNTLHVLLTGETESYYEAFAERPIHKLARLLAEGFVYQGEAWPLNEGETRGEPSAHLPPTAFVAFLQNHDQVGNRAFGERLRALTDPQTLKAALGLLLLSPQIPMLFMGEEWGSTQPFLFFTSYEGELAEAVREGRRKEFAKFSAFSDEKKRSRIPDPNDERTFLDSSPRPRESGSSEQADWLAFYRSALKVRAAELMPRLAGSMACGAEVLYATAIGDGAATDRAAQSSTETNAVVARWRLGDGALLTIALNLGDVAATLPQAPTGRIIFDTPHQLFGAIDRSQAATPLTLPAASCGVWLDPSGGGADPVAAVERS